jgi:hypothetical protein
MSTGQKHPGMHPIDDDLVRWLIAGQFRQWAGLAVERWPSGGTVNAMYRLGDDMVVRLPLVQGGAEDVSMEQGWLPCLAPHLPTRIPEVLGAGKPAQGYPWRPPRARLSSCQSRTIPPEAASHSLFEPVSSGEWLGLGNAPAWWAQRG